MKTLLLLAPAALLTIGAMPHPPGPGHGPGAHAPLPACSATVRDNCRQRDKAYHPRHGPDSELNSVVAADRPHPHPAPPRPEAVARNYPPCSATVRDRCIQSEGRRYARRAPPSRRMQLAIRYAGDRG